LILYSAVDVKELYRIGLPMGETHSMDALHAEGEDGVTVLCPGTWVLGSNGAESAMKSVKGRV